MRTRNKYQWWCFTILTGMVLSGLLIMNKKNNSFVPLIVPQHQQLITTDLTPLFLAPIKHVTKSLAELGKMDEINKHLVFFNLIPNSGWEAIVFLLNKLQGVNSFKHVRLQKSESQLSAVQQEKLVDVVYNLMRTHAVPLTVSKQVHFTNFTQFDRQSPTFISLIRDPANKILTRSNNKFRNDKKCLADPNNCDFIKLDLSIPYFCGQDSKCLRVNSEWALTMAKKNVRKYYAVVGILEEFDTTLQVLEKKVSYFFKGAQDVYENLDAIKKKQRKLKSSLNFRKILPKEYEFYDWIKKRLYEQRQKD